MEAVEVLAPEVGLQPACCAMGISRSTVYRHRKKEEGGHRHCWMKRTLRSPPVRHALQEPFRRLMYSCLSEETSPMPRALWSSPSVWITPRRKSSAS